MDLKISHFEFGTRPDKHLPNNDLLKYVGEDGIRQMVSKHYDLLSKSSINHLFSSSKNGLNKAKKHSADFFIQRLGGPDYFAKTRGKPMLAKRHAKFAITPQARVVWLECYKEVLEEMDAPLDLKVQFWLWLDEFSHWMVNTQSQSSLIVK